MFDLISIIVPVYNTGMYLDTCVDSIISQENVNIEVIIVDDGSTDEYTLKKCSEIKEKYPSVVLIHKPNGGSASARNYGIKIAKGKYIGFVDSDDNVDPKMYSELLSLIKKDQVNVAICGLATYGNNGVTYDDKSLESRCYEQPELMHHFLLGHWHSACTNLYSKELFKGISFPENEVNEDYMLNYWIFKNQKKISFTNNPYYHYIRRKNSNTSSPKTLRFLDWIKHTNLVLSEISQNPALKMEAEYQYIYSNIVLGKSSLLTLCKIKSEEAEQLYKIVSANLASSRKMLYHNKFLSMRNLITGMMMAECHLLYKFCVLRFYKMKNYIWKKD